ncbi:long-chain-fatty-acid--CoA ligase [Natrinema versiforme]|uniref:AMP-dependent synthetase and ligase n=1 Tax=Natrinema versiforme JCM 10478 TaxID=1227496 RepID=L9Y4Y1_9EURY|nr:long-chain-fatty-acid--CoA ligase [Natrinema versiforme]ELY68782.1 AMP-dependent synthetase and ligase [Natrinema versiforme JCM 10478]
MHKPLLVPEFLDRARTHYGDDEAVVATTGERFTYDELGERADRFAAALQDRGIEKGDRVAVLDPNTHYHLEAAYGIMQTGAIHTPLNYRLTPDDFEYILSDAGVDAIYADYDFAEKIEEIRDEVPTETFVTNDADAVEGGEAGEAGRSSSDSSDVEWEEFDAVLKEAGTDYHRPEMSEDEIITINYTSGTTGDPKGVCRTHRCETIHAYLLVGHQEITDDDTYLWTLPMFHANGWGHIFAVTGIGAKHVCTRGVDAAEIFEAVRSEDVSYMCGAPTVLNMLVTYYQEHDPETTGERDVRLATAGSAPPEATIRTVEDEFDWYLKHVYGATETGPLITTSDARRHFEDGSDDRFRIKKRQGLAYLGTEIRVVDEDGTDIPRDDETLGEVVVRGNQIMEKYWEKPDATEAAFNDRVEGYYHTGDLATIDDNGMIAIQDRKKDIIISGGENISSIELEDTLFDHDAVADVAVIPAPSDEWGETPKAYVVPASGDPDDPGVTESDLEAFTRETLAGYKTVRRIEFVEELPTTATGKVQKYELRQEEWADEERMVGQG